MSDQVRWPREAWLPLVAGLFWLWRAPEHGLMGFAFSVVPGCLLLGSGVSMLLMPGDRRISHFAALGGALGVFLALPAFTVVGPGAALLLIALSAAGFVAAGAHSVRLEPNTDEVPEAIPSHWLSAQVALDEALLATVHTTIALPQGSDHARVQREVAEARELFESVGWLEKPVDYHLRPPSLEAPELRSTRIHRIRYEQLSFESGYAPHPDEPGRSRWLSYTPSRTGHALVLRHAGGPRPWLVCIHGFQMGWPLIDFAAFPPPWLHERLGMNLLVPTLPLHGRRKVGRRSGDGFITGDILDSVHAEAQTIWDIRRLLSWVREDQAAPAVGAMGYSLGGYNTALLSSLDNDLACAIPGIPLADFTRAIYQHGPVLHLRTAEQAGLEEERVRDVMSVVSPLVLEPQLPRERRYIFGAVADRLVPPDQVRDLWRHWDRPRIEWYQGGHVSFRAHRSVARFIGTALRESGLAAPASRRS
jgi:dienelactone hydrolase